MKLLELVGQVREVRVDRTQRRVDRRCAGDLHLEEVHGALQVVEPVLSEIDEVEVVVVHELLDDAGADHLPAVGDGHHGARPD